MLTNWGRPTAWAIPRQVSKKFAKEATVTFSAGSIGKILMTTENQPALHSLFHDAQSVT
jgi:ABC-type sulfate transport system substrate-binding protein